jgi:hypothetical protein
MACCKDAKMVDERMTWLAFKLRSWKLRPRGGRSINGGKDNESCKGKWLFKLD